MTPKQTLRLEYLDGLRALASLYVVLFHAALGFSPEPVHGAGRTVQRALAYGHDAVAVFIVLSGYCLMIPVARAEGRMRALPHYFVRRAWRILPPYMATVLGTLLLMATVPILQTASHTIWDDSSPAYEFGSIVSHLLLVHNLFPAWVHTINGPLWSVATEWQIYFFFPLLLLPIWRRLGALPTVVVAFVLGCVPIWLAPATAHSSCSWYLGLFALGMCAAGVNFASRPAERALSTRVPWWPLTLLLVALVGIFATVLVRLWFRWMPLSDALVGAATACMLLHLTQHALYSAPRDRPRFLRLLESAPLVLVGRFSYSLYLTHLPVIALCYFGLRRASLSPTGRLLCLVAIGLPASLLVAYAFYWVFERRFVGSPKVLFGRGAA